MSPELATVLSALVIASFSAAVALITLRQNRKGQKATQALDERSVAKEEFDSIVRELRESLNTVKSDLREVEQEMETEVEARRAAEKRAEDAERRAADAERRAAAAEEQVSQLTHRVKQLEDELSIAKRALRVAVHDDEHGPHTPPSP